MSENTISKDAIMVERTFNAPVERIWQMWTQPEHLINWYGPQGFSVTITEMDVRVGGRHLFCMTSADGSMKMWLVGEYTEIVPNKRLVYTDSMSDEQGNILPPSAFGESDDFPTVTVVTVMLEDLHGRTKMVVTHAGVPANDEGAVAGWEQALNKMADYVETVLNSK